MTVQYQGVWSLQSAAQLQSTQRWVTDPLFENTTLLLQADDAANGAQNNTFLDSSSNNFAITRNGNTTQGSFTPFSLQPGAWSNFASAASASVGFSNATAALVGSTATTFTAECWIYMTDAPVSGDGVPALIGMDATFNSSIYLGFGPNASQKLVLRWFDGVSKTATGNTTLALNTWYHIAVVANSNALAMYVNGVPEVLTGTTTLTNRNGTTNTFSLFLNSSASNYQFRGYASNIRVCTSAVYTSAFTPSTTPLTTTSQGATNCRLLTSQNNLFIDNSSNAYTLTLQGAPSVQAFSPFAPQFQWTPSVIGGSGYFDGTGDFLVTPTSSNLSLATNTSDFSFECWVYNNGFSGSQFGRGIFIYYPSGSYASTRLMVRLSSSSNKINMFLFQSGFAQFGGSGTDSTGVCTPSAWTHVAFIRNSNTFYLYLNGALDTTLTASFQPQDLAFNTYNVIEVGRTQDGTTPDFNGYISGFRFVRNSAVYTAAFTPPTAPPTAITNTSLLLNFTNAGIFDGTMKNNLETVGNAQVSTAVVKYGSGSMFFDGNGDNLAAPVNNDLNFGTGDFTVECWVNITTRTLNYPLIAGNNNGGFSAGAIALTNSNFDNAAYYDRFVLSVFDIAGSGSAPALVAGVPNALNTWYHLAIVRNNTSLVMYRDGVAVASRTISAAIVFNWGKLGLRVGGGNWDGANSWFNGYLDDMRFTRFARYTQNFIPPSVALPRQ